MTTIVGSTTNYHNPIGGGESLTPAAFNQRFANLDAAIDEVAGRAGTSISVTLGEGVGIRDAGYVRESDGQGYLIDNNDATPDVGSVRGFWTATEVSGQTGTLQLSGVLGGFTGLTAGAPVFASDTAGGITQTRPTPTLDGAQVAVVILGVAISATEIFVRSRRVNYLKRVDLAQDETVTITHAPDPAGRLRDAWAYVSQASGVSAIVAYASSNQDADYALRNGIVATYGADQTTGGTPFGDAPSSGSLSQAFDNNTGIAPVWGSSSVIVGYDFGSGNDKAIAQYRLTEATNRGETLMFSAWQFQWSDDNSAWTTVDSQTGQSFSNGETKTYNFTPDGAHRYWRLSVTDNNGNSSSSVGDIDMQEAATFTTDADELAQTFTTSQAATVTNVQLYLRKVGTPTGTLTCTIETLSSSNPSGTLVNANATATVAESSLATGYALVTFDFTDFSLAAGSYAIVLNTDRAVADSSADWVEWGYDSSAPGYGGGTMVRVANTIWQNITGDAIFALNKPGVVITSRMSVGWWSSTFSDVVNRYGDVSGNNLNTQTTFKCVRAAGFDDITVVVELP